ncbi:MULTISPECIES: GNAT family N-acetyltransferase [Bacteria]
MIRPISADDHAEWLDLWNAYIAFYEASVPDEVTAFTFGRLINDDEAMYGAMARDASGWAVGIVRWLTHSATWSRVPDVYLEDLYVYLEDLYVDPAARGGGVGRALMGHVERWARERGAAKVLFTQTLLEEFLFLAVNRRVVGDRVAARCALRVHDRTDDKCRGDQPVEPRQCLAPSELAVTRTAHQGDAAGDRRDKACAEEVLAHGPTLPKVRAPRPWLTIRFGFLSHPKSRDTSLARSAR